MSLNLKKTIAVMYLGTFLVNFIFLFIFLFLPTNVYSAQSTTAGNTGITYECGDGLTAGECDFADLLAAVDKVVEWGRNIALSISAVVLVIAGFRYMTSEGNPGKLREANHMFVLVGWGIVFILGAWAIVHLITSTLLNPNLDYGVII